NIIEKRFWTSQNDSVNLLDIFFPRVCVGCGRWGSYLCLICQKEIIQSDLVCPACERPSIGGKVHPICIKKYGLDGLWFLGVYQDPLKKVIQKLKYNFVSDSASTLVEMMVLYWANFSPQFIDEIKKDQGKSWIVAP